MLEARDLALSGRLDRLSATFARGAVTAICGPNGAGKSSLLACLAGIALPDAGDILLDGRHLASLPPQERARSIGYLPQTHEIAWDVSVEVLVSLGRIPWRGAGDSAVNSAIATMDLEPLRHRPVSRLSGGERARALLARVLAGEPHWLLADEPLANLDLAHAMGLLARLHEQARAGRGVVLVLHDLAMAMNHADRVLVLDHGRVVADGPPAAALNESAIDSVWGVKAHWVGQPGALALAIGS